MSPAPAEDGAAGRIGHLPRWHLHGRTTCDFRDAALQAFRLALKGQPGGSYVCASSLEGKAFVLYRARLQGFMHACSLGLGIQGGLVDGTLP